MKPSIPKGTRDFGPSDVRKRNFIFDTIRSVFEIHGYQPIETPSMENLTTLTGKYGEEGDQLLFKILNNGDFLSKVDAEALAAKNSSAALSQLAKRGLRYDLTVPFARYVVMNHHALSFPFKRYQIQPVWRADRPQKGRYQEFYQCDVDVVGSDSLMYEAELVQIYDKVFTRLGLDVEILVNNRKVLEGIAEVNGVSEHFVAMVTALDKLDKIGEEKVMEEITKKGISPEAAQNILSQVQYDSIEALADILATSEQGSLGVREMRDLQTYLEGYETGTSEVVYDFTLARGLSYYTGCVFEVKAKNVQMGSIGGGGRYDNLTETFGMKDMSGVGVSFGAERIFLVMEELGLFPDDTNKSLDVFLMALDEESHSYCRSLLQKLRQANIKSDMYPIVAKMKKMMKYANGVQAPNVIVIGESERKSDEFKLKDMESGEQTLMNPESLIAFFK